MNFHTSDLTDACPGRRLLVRAGKYEPRVTKALYRGLLVHAALALVHQENSEPLARAAEQVEEGVEAEGRIFTDAAEAGRAATIHEVASLIEAYRTRILPITSGWAIHGTEVPIHMEMDGHDFSSHIDLFATDGDRPVVWDWKSGQLATPFTYLHRHPQLAAYWLAIRRGSVLIGDEWVQPGAWPRCAIIDINALKPYRRTTRTKDEHGRTRIYEPGMDRPISRVVHWVD